ncbi:PREDICTED: miraculin-like [Ipomoea nil]|uniref:miraculin-like n=1 Tax=Ipomoea nil TaxID=35883 RepID=UPI000900B62B|nr:PREDICTED: miraculin-like [Ipomoea nil]
MKTAIILLVLSAISFLPLAISGGLPPLIRLPTKADVPDNAILDTAGNPVVAGAKYYAIPALIGVEGGISVANPDTGNPSACPTDVVINVTLAGHQPPAVGLPLTFYPLKREAEASRSAAATDDDVIISQYPLNVAFDSPDPSDPCAKENVWKLNDETAIVTGGVIGVVKGDLGNWFRIQKNFNGKGYLFNWWPSLCLYCRIGYWHIGTVGGGYQLGINYRDESLYAFEFVKAG